MLKRFYLISIRLAYFNRICGYFNSAVDSACSQMTEYKCESGQSKETYFLLGYEPELVRECEKNYITL